MSGTVALRTPEKIHVLVVDDDPDMHLVIDDVLQETRLSFDTCFVTSVPDAMRIVESGQPVDVILVDYLIRPNTGFDLFTFIENRNLKIPCIVMTSYDSPQLDERAIKSGIADLVVKRDLNPGILKRSILYSIRDSQLQKQLELLAHYDQLTKLTNRTLFFDRLETACRYAHREQSGQYSVLYIDLDYFKVINDTFGHAIGDELLKEFAQLLKAQLRESDTAARLAGDEFAVLLHHAAPPVAHMIAQKILRAVEKPVWVGEHQIQISLSIGIATTENSGLDPQVLMMDADRALYAAKKSGRDTYFHFNRARALDLHDQVALEQDLKRAINQNQFIMYYQPRFTAKGLKLSGFEALVRWNHPTRGIISPGSFLDSLHRMGLEKAFTQLTMELFFQDIHSLGTALGTQKMAFNLIPHQCLDPHFERSFVGLMNKHGLSPQNICIEITEYHLMSQLERLLQPLSSLREMGVQIALDDFGEKYSSLTMLAGLPVDVLKIDKQFIQQAREDEKVARIFEAIAAMAKGLNLISVAEGVEEDAHIQVATTLGCDELQGYALGKPISLAATVEKLFSSANINPSPGYDNSNNSQCLNVGTDIRRY